MDIAERRKPHFPFSSRFTGKAIGSHAPEKSGNLLLTGIFLSLLYVDCLSGALRYALGAVGLAFLIYIPFFLSFVYLLASPVFNRKSYIQNPRALILVPFFLLYLVYSFLNLSGLAQAAFGFYAWAPFLMGFAYASESDPEKLYRHFMWLWGIAVAGVLMNYFVAFPWMGASVDVFGVDVTASRDWEALGIKRLAGFSRASYTAAMQIALFACYMFIAHKNVVVRFCIFALSFVAIFFTTSKTPLAGLVACYGFLTVGDFLFWKEKRKKALFSYCWTTLAGLIVLVVVVPLIYLGTSDLNVSFNFYGELSFIRLDSLIQRMTQMWPDAFNLIAKDNAPLEWFFGRGFGGIGAGQQFGEINSLNAADNIFIYLYVTFGILSSLFALLVLRGFSSLKNEKPSVQLLYAGFLVFILIVGVTASIIESVCPMLILGLVCGMTPRKEHVKKEALIKSLATRRA